LPLRRIEIILIAKTNHGCGSTTYYKYYNNIEFPIIPNSIRIGDMILKNIELFFNLNTGLTYLVGDTNKFKTSDNWREISNNEKFEIFEIARGRPG
jgi:hypothetical protein